jgi:hypothetical protein
MWRRAAPFVLSLLVLAACGGSDATSPAAGAAGDDAPATVGAPAPEGIAGVLAFGPADSKTDQAHVNGRVTYPTSPPTRGPHNATWQNCGFYTKAVGTENAVHSLEHGAVWITYGASVDAAARTALTALAKGNGFVLVSPFDDNPAPFVLTAWGRQLRVETITDPRVATFIDTYAKDGPTVPEKGAPCSGALGVPPDRPTTLDS